MAVTQCVLVVQDERKIRDLLRTYLEHDGLTVITTASGAEAITQAGRARPDLIVLDLRLPDVPGEDGAREVRTQAAIPILMLTAKTGTADRMAWNSAPTTTSPNRSAPAKSSCGSAPSSAGGSDQPASYGGGQLLIDENRHQVTAHGQPAGLTATERKLLTTLASALRPGVQPLRTRQPGPRLRVRMLRTHHRLPHPQPPPQDRRCSPHAGAHRHRDRYRLPARNHPRPRPCPATRGRAGPGGQLAAVSASSHPRQAARHRPQPAQFTLAADGISAGIGVTEILDLAGVLRGGLDALADLVAGQRQCRHHHQQQQQQQQQVGAAAACRPGPRSCPEVPFAGGAPRYTALRY